MTSTLFCILLVAALPCGQSISAIHSCVSLGNASCTPIFFLAEGPTGSGKSGQEQQLQMLYSLKTDGLLKDPPKMLLIDDFVEKDAGYRANILAYLKKNLGDTPTKEAVDKWLDHADASVYDYFAKQYFGSRAEWGCNFNGTGGCETAFDNMVNESFKEGHNVIWETTGKRYPTDKIAIMNKSPEHYKTVVGLNVVEFCDLQRRNSGRAGGSIMKFMAHPEDLSIAAPRLPDLSQLGAAVDKITKANLAIIDCIGEPVSEKCPGKIDELYVFSNEHWGFMPSIKVKPPKIHSVHAQKAFEEVKKSAKKMLSYGLSKPCTPTLVV